MKIFVTFDCDWADEFSAYGFRIFTPVEWADYRKGLHDHSGNLSYSFGTNEGWEDEDADFFLSAMTITELSDEDAAKIIEIFQIKKYDWQNSIEWGHFPDFDFDELDRDEL